MAAGYVVHTAAPSDEPSDDYQQALEALTGQSHITLHRLSPRSRNGVSDLACLRELTALYRRLRPDLVVHFTIKPNVFGGMAARRAGVAYLAVITGLGYTFLHGGWRNQRLVPRLYRWGLKGMAATIFYNLADRELFRQRGIVAPNAGHIINGSGVNLGHFRAVPLPPRKPGEPTRFLFLGRILRDKGLLELLAACHLLLDRGLDFRLTIAGSLRARNPEVIGEATFLTSVEAINARRTTSTPIVRYLPPVADVRPLLAESHCFVLPSYREGLSIAGAEALATGRPVVVTDVPGCVELVDPGQTPNGFLVPARNVRALADALQRIIECPDEDLSTMGQRSHQRAAAIFSAEITTRRFLERVHTALAP